MSRIAMLSFALKKTVKNVNGILLYLASSNPDDLWSRKIAIQNGKGGCQIPAPGEYVLTWYITGSAGGAIQVEIYDDGELIDTLEVDETAIADGDTENYGLFEFELGA